MWGADTFLACAALITALIISYSSMPVIIRVDTMKKFMDEPDHIRKLHKSVIPTLGGLGIFGSFLISFSLWGRANNMESYPFFVASLLMLFLIGLKDDILMLSPLKKLLVQILAASVVVIAGNLRINSLDGLFGIYQMPEILGSFITIIVIVTIINAINLIDGIDGLAGGIGIISASVLGILFWNIQEYQMATMAFVLSGALIGFLAYNFSPAKIFMGDTGSMIVGFILAYISLQYLKVNDAMINTSGFLAVAPVITLSILVIPLFDTFRVFFLRILKRQSPFRADNNHIHHILLRNGYTHASAAIALWLSNILIIAFVMYLKDININILFAIITVISFLIIPGLIIIEKVLGTIFNNNAQIRDKSRLINKIRIPSSNTFNNPDNQRVEDNRIAEFNNDYD